VASAGARSTSSGGTTSTFANRELLITEDVAAKNAVGKVGMSDELYAILKAWQTKAEFKFGNDYVISTETRTMYHPSTITRQLHRIADAAGVEGLQLHHLRHNLASALIWADVSDMIITLQMRHANTHVTRTIYEHIYRAKESREEATAAINRAMAQV
jgi:integrase